MDYVAVVCRCLICGVFGIASLSKLRGRAAFDEFVRSAEALLPAAVTRSGASQWIGAVVVVVEFAVAVLTAVSGTALIGFGLAAAALTVFTIGIAVAVRRGVRVSCRCFGAATSPLGTRHLIRNALLLLVAGVGLALGPGDLGGAHPAGLLVAACAAAVLVVVVIRFDDLVDLSTPLSGSRWSTQDR